MCFKVFSEHELIPHATQHYFPKQSGCIVRYVVETTLKADLQNRRLPGKKTGFHFPSLHSLSHFSLLLYPEERASELLPAERRRVSLFLECKDGIEEKFPPYWLLPFNTVAKTTSLKAVSKSRKIAYTLSRSSGLFHIVITPFKKKKKKKVVPRYNILFCD